MIVRFGMIHSDTGKVESGANYPGCSQSNPAACKPMTFANLQDAEFYCHENDETLYVVGSAVSGTADWTTLTNKVWDFVTHPDSIPPLPTFGDNTMLYVGGALLAAYFLL